MFTADNAGDLNRMTAAEMSGWVVRLDRLPRQVHEALGPQLTLAGDGGSRHLAGLLPMPMGQLAIRSC